MVQHGRLLWDVNVMKTCRVVPSCRESRNSGMAKPEVDKLILLSIESDRVFMLFSEP